jgi:deoxyribose-phosphate aldolase
LTLKVILETGELRDAALIGRACALALDAGADFLKTSTGKTPVSATPDAARVLLGAIATDAAACGHVGFKPSGGIRTVADAALYIALTRDALGAEAVTPQRFRIGASGLLNDIEAVLGDADRPAAATGY